MKNLTTGLIAVAIIMMIGLGCSGSDTKTADNSTANKSNENTANKSNDNKVTTTSSPNTSGNSDKFPTDDDLAGNYGINGKNARGQSYSGTLGVKKQGEVFQFTWNTEGGTYDGVGIQGGNLVAAGFTTGSDGKGCGAAIYEIHDNTLDGRFASWGFNSTATQTATLINQTKTSGTFNVEGMDTDGSPYKGTLAIKQNGDLYQLSFGGKAVFQGTGIREGNYLAVGVGTSKCAFAVYEIKNGDLQGIWGGIGTSKVGTEIAIKK